MPRYDAQRIEAKWQAYWDKHQTFRTPEPSERPHADKANKLYVLDMFPYPSGSGLHVGHPEGYTATDIVCRSARMRGKHVLHPMGWDAFGLPAEEHAVKTGTHPRETTLKNINEFRRQLKMLGFSYDWSRELSTTDTGYYRWTQWIFLKIFDTWYDPDCEWTGPDGRRHTGRGRPISELPIPADMQSQGQEAVRRYQDRHRLAYQHEAPVNWCPALGTVLANEEVIDGKSEVGGHPVERLPLRQWMLRITSYAERLIDDLDQLDWSESIKALQRNWIGRSEGAEVDFFIGPAAASLSATSPSAASPGAPTPLAVSRSSAANAPFEAWKSRRAATGFPPNPGDDVLRIYTTRPDTLFGATYMVLAPEHPFVARLTKPAQKEAVEAYCRRASTKSDLDRTDLAKDKTGVFTGSYATNPVNGAAVPIWIADYVLISYGTGAIMAVPAHDKRDFEFAVNFQLSIIPVVKPSAATPDDFDALYRTLLGKQGLFALAYLPNHVGSQDPQELIRAHVQSAQIAPHVQVRRVTGGWALIQSYPLENQTWVKWPGPSYWLSLHEHDEFDGLAINSEVYNGLTTLEFKKRISADLAKEGLGKKAINYRLRDWLFSRQRYWGEPFPIWHEIDAKGHPTGLLRADSESDLPILLPDMADFKPTGTPEPMLAKAPGDWLYKTASDGTRLKRETNSMPQWAGSCWYYLRFCDPKNSAAFLDPAREKYWLPVDLYIGGAEHAVLHLLYARFWHKVLFDRGHVTTVEPFQKLVNQGMILGEMEFTGVRYRGVPVSCTQSDVPTSGAELFEGHQILHSEVELPLTETFETVKLREADVLKKGDRYFWRSHPDKYLVGRSYKMSKSRGNVINPDKVVGEYGADSLRLYEMFMGPLEAVKPWSMSGVEGVFRFLGRVWRMVADDRADDVRLNPAVQDVSPTEAQLRILHKTIRAVTDDIDKMSFNTAISRMMEFTNEVSGQEPRPKSILEPFILILSPFAPHLAEELWELLGHSTTLAYEPWPAVDERHLIENEIEIPVQVNGKLRAVIRVAKEADQATIRAVAESHEAVQSHIAGKTIAKCVVVPGRLVNFVVK